MSRRQAIAFARRRGSLWCENVPLYTVAEKAGTPTYVYSKARLLSNYRAIAEGPERPSLVCYAVKALSNLSVLRLLGEAGCGFDVVSGGELARVLAAGGDASKVVFSGVAKTDAELAEALWAGSGCFNVESEQELVQLSDVAVRVGKTAPIALRVNPHVDARTHRHIATALRESKFGIPIGRARALYKEAAQLPGLQIRGLAFHLGSQITQLSPFREALAAVRKLCVTLLEEGHPLRHVDAGGGLGIRYTGNAPPTPQAWLRALRAGLRGLPLQLFVAPGRAIAADAGLLLTRVLGCKDGEDRRFVLVDAAMNDLLRPALYDAFHEIVAVGAPGKRLRRVDVVGPVCESADTLGKQRRLPDVAAGDLLAILDAGAYGFSMASSYNSRPRAAEVLVDGGEARIIRARESREDLWRGEAV